MKNITVFAVLVIMVSTAADADEPVSNYCFSISPQFGFVRGQAQELVYSVPGQTKNDLLSELKWDMKPVFYLGFQMGFERAYIMSKPGFFASFDFKTGIPADSGIMEDRDWLWPANANLTRFSSHTNKTNEFFTINLAAGASIPLGSYFYIKPFINGSWMRFAFTGRNGYGYYADLKEPEQTFSGEVITYKQDWFLIAAGITAGVKLPYDFTIELSFQISPFSYCVAEDNHIYGNTFKDFTYGDLFLEPALNLSYSLEYIDFSLNCSYRYIARTEGNSYINEDTVPDKNKGGAGLSLWDTRLIVKFKLY
jgi:outer membrane protease